MMAIKNHIDSLSAIQIDIHRHKIQGTMAEDKDLIDLCLMRTDILTRCAKIAEEACITERLFMDSI
jgi:hypothetical protein